MLALDLRGHGRSERRPASLELDALVEDAGAAAATFELAPVVVGQSLGGAIAIALAAWAPELVHAAVVVEASPSRDPCAAREVREWLDSWPAPFKGREDAERFFGGGACGAAWADGLEETPRGLVSRFDPDVVEELVRAVTKIDLWEDWQRIECPILVVRGGRGSLTTAEAKRMAEANPRAWVAAVEAAGHDLHLDDPSGFGTVVEPFLAEVLV